MEWPCLVQSGELAPRPVPTDRPAVFSAHFASVIIFRMQGSLPCTECKWAIYILHFIILSLLLPGTVLPCQDSSTGPSVRGFPCLPAPPSFWKLHLSRSLSVEASVPSCSGPWGNGNAHTSDGRVLLGQFTSTVTRILRGRVVEEKNLHTFHLSYMRLFQQIENYENISW